MTEGSHPVLITDTSLKHTSVYISCVLWSMIFFFFFCGSLILRTGDILQFAELIFEVVKDWLFDLGIIEFWGFSESHVLNIFGFLVQSALLGWLWELPAAKELMGYGTMALWR